MESTHTFGIDLLIRKCKRNKNRHSSTPVSPLIAERAEISTKEKIDAAAWDATKEVVKGKTIGVKEINRHLDDIRHKIRSKYRMLKESEFLLTAERVKEAYEGILASQKGHTLMELITYYKKIWKTKTKKGGFKNYKTTIDYLTKFLQSKYPSKDVYLAQLNMEFATEFEHYVRTSPLKEHDPGLGNGVGKHMQRFKRILNWGADAKDGIGWMKTNPCGKYSCPLKKGKRKKLTFELLVKLEQKAFQDATLNCVKQLFLFNCYTGFAFADVMALRESHFEWDGDEIIWCRMYRAKSDILSPIPPVKSCCQNHQPASKLSWPGAWRFHLQTTHQSVRQPLLKDHPRGLRIRCPADLACCPAHLCKNFGAEERNSLGNRSIDDGAHQDHHNADLRRR